MFYNKTHLNILNVQLNYIDVNYGDNFLIECMFALYAKCITLNTSIELYWRIYIFYDGYFSKIVDCFDVSYWPECKSIIIIYHDFLPPPRRVVMSSQITLAQLSNKHPLVHIIGTCALISVVAPCLQFSHQRSGAPCLQFSHQRSGAPCLQFSHHRSGAPCLQFSHQRSRARSESTQEPRKNDLKVKR